MEIQHSMVLTVLSTTVPILCLTSSVPTIQTEEENSFQKIIYESCMQHRMFPNSNLLVFKLKKENSCSHLIPKAKSYSHDFSKGEQVI
jgi:hypothetical protein